MTRFCKQHDTYSCGPVALLNIDKFFGQRVTYKQLPRYSKRVQCVPPDGTFPEAISRILGRAKRKAWEKAKQFLKDGGCIMVQSKDHYYLMLMNHREDIGVVNYYGAGHGAIHISPQRASRWLKDARRTWYVDNTTGVSQ
jgi:hypothetical protein